MNDDTKIEHFDAASKRAKDAADEARGRRAIAQMGYELVQVEALPEGTEFCAVRGFTDPVGREVPPCILARDVRALARAIGQTFTDQQVLFIGRIPFDELVAGLQRRRAPRV